VYRRRAALDLEGFQCFRAHVGLDQPEGTVSEQDLPRLRPLLEPRRDVDGIAGSEGLASRSAPHENVPGVHSDSDGELDAARPEQLVA